jgi:carbon monoxide dehydrogenase subunit G
MKMNGDQLIHAPRQQVWEALNDPEVLRQCIPGCQSLEKEADDRLKAVVAIKVGPIGARFNGAVTLSELDPPSSYLISGEGQGGAAGFARGSARVVLVDEGEATRLSYTVDAEVGGRLAQVGGPIIDATAKQLAGLFFKRFGGIVTEAKVAVAPKDETPAAQPEAVPAPESTASPPIAAPVASPGPILPVAQQPSRSNPFVWIIAVFLAALAGFLAGHGQSPELWQGAVLGIAIAGMAAASYASGRSSGSIVVTLDPAVSQLIARGQGRQS